MTINIDDIRLKRATAARWAELNPILNDGEPGYDETNKVLKIGDGIAPWSDLIPVGYFSGGVTNQQLLDHINSLTPHPAYDEGPSFTLLYENAKV